MGGWRGADLVEHGCSLLHYAVFANNRDVCHEFLCGNEQGTLLLDLPMSVDKRSVTSEIALMFGTYRPLHLAMIFSDVGVVNELLAFRASPRQYVMGHLPLHCTFFECRPVEMVEKV